MKHTSSPTPQESRGQSAKSGKNDKKNPKRGGPKDEDDESVDDQGNIRNLINYEDSEAESDNSDLSLTPSERATLKKKGKLPNRLREQIRNTGRRQAAIIAEEKIRKKMKKEQARKTTPTTDSSDSTFEITEDETVKRKKFGFPPRKAKAKAKAKAKGKAKRQEEEEEEEEEDGETLGSQDTDEDEEEEEEEDEDDEDDEDDDSEEEDDDAGFKGISISFGGIGGGMDDSERMIPKRHNMKKETEDVRKFVKLVSKPVEEENIDDQIDQFKSMDSS
jgi:hypothetical protein